MAIVRHAAHIRGAGDIVSSRFLVASGEKNVEFKDAQLAWSIAHCRDKNYPPPWSFARSTRIKAVPLRTDTQSSLPYTRLSFHLHGLTYC